MPVPLLQFLHAPSPLQPQSLKKPHQIFRQASLWLARNLFSQPRLVPRLEEQAFPPCLRPLHRAHPSPRGGGVRRSLGLPPLQAVLLCSPALKPSPPMPLAENPPLCLRLPPPQLGLAHPFSHDQHPHRLNEHAAALPPPCSRSQLRSWPEPIPIPATFSTS